MGLTDETGYRMVYKSWQSLGAGIGMGVNHCERQGVRLEKTIPLISIPDSQSVTVYPDLRIRECDRHKLKKAEGNDVSEPKMETKQ